MMEGLQRAVGIATDTVFRSYHAVVDIITVSCHVALGGAGLLLPRAENHFCV